LVADEHDPLRLALAARDLAEQSLRRGLVDRPAELDRCAPASRARRELGRLPRAHGGRGEHELRRLAEAREEASDRLRRAPPAAPERALVVAASRRRRAL